MFSLANILPKLIALSGAFAVLFGAWLSHGAAHLPLTSQQSLQTALMYQMFHTLALLSLYVWYNRAPQKMLAVTIALMLLGTCLFSGSIYIKHLALITQAGKLAPLGGVCLALAWASLIFQGRKR